MVVNGNSLWLVYATCVGLGTFFTLSTVKHIGAAGRFSRSCMPTRPTSYRSHAASCSCTPVEAYWPAWCCLRILMLSWQGLLLCVLKGLSVACNACLRWVCVQVAAPAQVSQAPPVDVSTVKQFCGHWVKVRGANRLTCGRSGVGDNEDSSTQHAPTAAHRLQAGQVARCGSCGRGYIS